METINQCAGAHGGAPFGSVGRVVQKHGLPEMWEAPQAPNPWRPLENFGAPKERYVMAWGVSPRIEGIKRI